MSENSHNNRRGDVNSLKINEMNEVEIINDELIQIKIELNEKIIENENYQQETHELRNKLKASLATQKDLLDSNEIIENNLIHVQTTLEERINAILEKFTAEKKTWEEKITELQTSLLCEEKKNEKLREMLNDKEKLFAQLHNEDPDKTQETTILKEKINCLIDDLEKKEIVEIELLSKQQQLEENNNTLQKNYNELRDILQMKKVDLESLKDTLETTKDELFVCRSELESLKATPASDSIKGNSLFAEVEDNRRKLVSDMISLKKKYLHMKQTYDSKEREIRLLQAEKEALLRKLEDETVGAVDQSARLIDAYKSRISELEAKLKIAEKEVKMKDREQTSGDNNFSYLQNLLTAKKKKIEELCDKLEESSIQKILLEEMKYESERQSRHWQYKAMSYKAQLLAVENQTKCDGCIKNKLKDSQAANPSIETNDKQRDCQVVENAPKTLEKFLEIPKTSTQEGDPSTGIDLEKSKEQILRSGNCNESINMEETLPISHGPSALMKLPQDRESKEENNASGSNAKEIILKSALAKSDEKSPVSIGEEKTKKLLRFSPDTAVDLEKSKLTRQKVKEKKPYPIVFISSNQ